MCVKYSTLLISDVIVIVVHPLYLIRKKHEALIGQNCFIYHNQNCLQLGFANELNTEIFYMW